MFFEEADEMFAGNSAILAARYAIAAQAAGIEPFTDRPGRDLTDFRDLPGGEDFFHGRHSISCIAESPPRPADAGGTAGEYSRPSWRISGCEEKRDTGPAGLARWQGGRESLWGGETTARIRGAQAGPTDLAKCDPQQGGPTKGTDKRRAAPDRSAGAGEQRLRVVFRLG